MVYRILSAFKRIAAVASIATFRNEPFKASFDETPEPRRQWADAPSRTLEDAWMFDMVPDLDSRTRALSGEVSRLSEALGGLRTLLSDIAKFAPTPAPMQVYAATAPIFADAALFDGEPLSVTPYVPALGDATFLFEGDHGVSRFDRPVARFLDQQIAA